MFDINAPLIAHWYVDDDGNKVSIVKNNQSYKIVHNTILLDGVPDYYYKVNIDNMTEQCLGTILTINDYVVDYALGLIKFHSSKEGQTIIINNWFSKGCYFYPASRIYTEVTDGTITETLGDLVEAGYEALNAVGGITGVINLANVTKANLETVISIANTVISALESDIETGDILHTTLEADISLAQVKNDALGVSTTSATNTKTALDTSNTNATNTKTALDSSNTVANTTKTNLDGSITTGNTLKIALDNDISVGNGLHTTLTSDISTATTKKTDLETSITNANTSKTALDMSKTNADASKAGLDSSTSTANTTKTALDTSISTANTTKSNLDIANNTASTNISNLNTVNNTATTKKTDLDSSVAIANTAKTELDGSVQNGENKIQEMDMLMTSVEQTQQTLESTNDALMVFENYSNVKNYVPLNRVYYQGSTYECLQSSTGVVPATRASNANWHLIALSGEGNINNVISTNSGLSVTNTDGDIELTVNGLSYDSNMGIVLIVLE